MKKVLLIFSILFLAPLAGLYAQERLEVSPVIIDQKALPRDIIQETITVTNHASFKADIYPFVRNVDVAEGEKEFKNRIDVELGESLANWISISRAGIELKPGESAEIPVTINVNLNAKPGNYHAMIHFNYGSTRAQAENRKDYRQSVAINIEVVENIKERLQLGAFTTKRFFFSPDDVSFAYELENIGNKDLNPKGEVRIYDRKGHEVDAIPANIDGTVIKPEETGLIASVWNGAGGFGKYKALLDIEYGSSQLGTVNDTIYFWIIPWKQLLALFFVLAALVGGGAYVWYSRYEKHAPQYAYAQARPRKTQKNSLFVDQYEFKPSVNSAPSEHHVMDMRQ